jgi:hypothetical protein
VESGKGLSFDSRAGLMEGATWGSVPFLEIAMHGMIGRSLNFLIPDDEGEGWEPYIPSIFKIREVARQIGYRPTLYVMRLFDGHRWLYRACSASELSVIEYRDVSR